MESACTSLPWSPLVQDELTITTFYCLLSKLLAAHAHLLVILGDRLTSGHNVHWPPWHTYQVLSRLGVKAVSAIFRPSSSGPRQYFEGTLWRLYGVLSSPNSLFDHPPVWKGRITDVFPFTGFINSIYEHIFFLHSHLINVLNYVPSKLMFWNSSP